MCGECWSFSDSLLTACWARSSAGDQAQALLRVLRVSPAIHTLDKYQYNALGDKIFRKNVLRDSVRHNDVLHSKIRMIMITIIMNMISTIRAFILMMMTLKHNNKSVAPRSGTAWGGRKKKATGASQPHQNHSTARVGFCGLFLAKNLQKRLDRKL